MPHSARRTTWLEKFVDLPPETILGDVYSYIVHTYGWPTYNTVSYTHLTLPTKRIV